MPLIRRVPSSEESPALVAGGMFPHAVGRMLAAEFLLVVDVCCPGKDEEEIGT